MRSVQVKLSGAGTPSVVDLSVVRRCRFLDGWRFHPSRIGHRRRQAASKRGRALRLVFNRFHHLAGEPNTGRRKKVARRVRRLSGLAGPYDAISRLGCPFEPEDSHMGPGSIGSPQAGDTRTVASTDKKGALRCITHLLSDRPGLADLKVLPTARSDHMETTESILNTGVNPRRPHQTMLGGESGAIIVRVSVQTCWCQNTSRLRKNSSKSSSGLFSGNRGERN